MKRLSGRQWSLKPQDLAIALKLVALQGRWLPYAALGEAMHLSRFEAHAAVQRLMAAGLVDETGGHPAPAREALRSFVQFGAPYAYPPVWVGTALGFPTAQRALPPAEDAVAESEPCPVWPHPEGGLRGPGLLPLYENLPLAARDDPVLYELLALFDLLRVGDDKEREFAMNTLGQKLNAPVTSTAAAARKDQDTIVIAPDLVIPRRALQHLASHHHIRRLCLFGSAARGELRPDSDIDLLVEFEPGQAPSLWTAQEVEMDLSRLFGGRPVDMVSPEILRNPYRRKQIEKDLKVLHEAS